MSLATKDIFTPYIPDSIAHREIITPTPEKTPPDTFLRIQLSRIMPRKLAELAYPSTTIEQRHIDHAGKQISETNARVTRIIDEVKMGYAHQAGTTLVPLHTDITQGSRHIIFQALVEQMGINILEPPSYQRDIKNNDATIGQEKLWLVNRPTFRDAFNSEWGIGVVQSSSVGQNEQTVTSIVTINRSSLATGKTQ